MGWKCLNTRLKTHHATRVSPLWVAGKVSLDSCVVPANASLPHMSTIADNWKWWQKNFSGLRMISWLHTLCVACLQMKLNFPLYKAGNRPQEWIWVLRGGWVTYLSSSVCRSWFCSACLLSLTSSNLTRSCSVCETSHAFSNSSTSGFPATWGTWNWKCRISSGSSVWRALSQVQVAFKVSISAGIILQLC